MLARGLIVGLVMLDAAALYLAIRTNGGENCGSDWMCSRFLRDLSPVAFIVLLVVLALVLVLRQSLPKR